MHRDDDLQDDLEADYARAGFGARLGFGTAPALLVVDVCRAYLDPSSPLYAGVEDAVASAGRLVEAARGAGVPVVWTRVRYDAAAPTVFHRKVPSLAVFDTPLGDFPEGVAPVPGERVVVKDFPSAFFATGLAEALRADGVDTVVLCGLSTSGCVRASALDALQHDFVPVVVREACGDRDARPHEAALFDLGAKYADVVGEAEVLARWTSGP